MIREMLKAGVLAGAFVQSRRQKDLALVKRLLEVYEREKRT